jgi:MFS transporter, ACS family, hexuronate transporter
LAKSYFERRTQYRNFLAVWASQTTAAILIFTFPALSPLLVTKYALTATQIGELTGIIYVGISGVSIFISVLSDLVGVRTVLIIGHSIEAIAIITASFAHTFAGFALSAFAVGIGYSAITPVTSKAIMIRFSKESRSFAMGLKQTGTTVGGSIAGAVLPIIGLTYGGSAAFLSAGILVFSGIFFVLVYRESEKFYASTGLTWKFLKQAISISLKNEDLVSLGAVGFFYAAVQSVVITYIALFALTVLGFGPIISGLFLSVVNIAGTIGRPVYGSISDRVFGGSRIKDFLLISITSFLMLIVLSSLDSGISFWEATPVVGLLGFAALGWNGVFLTLAGEYSNQGFEAVGTSLAFSIAMTGQIVGAPVFGLIIQATGSYAMGWIIFGLALAVAGAIFAIARRNRDPSRLGFQRRADL